MMTGNIIEGAYMKKIMAALFCLGYFAVAGLAGDADVRAAAQILDARFCWSDDLVDQLQLTVQISLVNTGSESTFQPTL